MKLRLHSIPAGQLRPVLGAGIACAFMAFAALAQAGKVTPPPLPPGSNLVKVEPGMDRQEQMRADRAHHHKGQNRKDINKDDSEVGNNGKGKIK